MKRLLGLLVCSSILYACSDSNTKAPADTATETGKVAAATESKDYEIGDEKYVELGKSGFANLSSGDIDTWMAGFADSAIYRWNNLDSLMGKPAITEYWKKRRTDVIESINFSSQVWLPIKLNKAQVPGQLTGNYALSWNLVTAKYKTGKTMVQRIHTVFHFDANDKVDRVFQYLDRVPINAAMAK